MQYGKRSIIGVKTNIKYFKLGIYIIQLGNSEVARDKDRYSLDLGYKGAERSGGVETGGAEQQQGGELIA